MKPERTVFVLSVLPWPPDRGDSIRVMSFLRGLDSFMEGPCTVLAVGPAARLTCEDKRRALELENGLNMDVMVFNRDSRYDHWRLRRGARWIESLVVGTPHWCTARFSSSLARHLDAMSDVSRTVLFGEAAGLYAAHAPTGSRLIWDRYNIQSASVRAAMSGMPVRARMAENVWRRYEPRIFDLVDQVVVSSPEEAQRMRDAFRRAPDQVIPSGVEVPAETPEQASRRPRVVGWMSNLDYVPNAMGLERFLREAWPRAASKGLQLQIVGGGTPPRRLQDTIKRTPGVRNLGFVESLSEWTAQIGVAVVPLWGGAGMKMKTLTLMAAGVPVVGTPDAFEGIPNGAAAVSSEPGELVDALVQFSALSSDALERLGRVGRAVVEREFSSGVVQRRFVSLLRAI